MPVKIPRDAESVCIVDWNGRYKPSNFPGAYWADYFPDYGVTTFGGDWSDVPDRPSKREPTEKQIYAWVLNSKLESTLETPINTVVDLIYEQIARRNPAVYGGLAAPLVFNIGFDNSKSSTTCGTYKESAGPNSTYVFAPKERAEFV